MASFNLPNLDYASAIGDMDLSGIPDQRPWYSKALGGASNAINSDPAKWSIMLDMLGRGIAPDNPFGGIGTALGQSSKANQARQEGRQDWNSFITQLMQGTNMGGMTQPVEAGRNDIKITPGPEDSDMDKITTSFNIPKLGAKKKDQFMNMSDVVSSPF